MGRMVKRRQILAKQYAIMILRDDMGKTWEQIGEIMEMCGSWCRTLYNRTIEDEAVDKNLFETLWV